MHMVRFLRKSRHLPTIPSRHAARCHSQFLGRQSPMLDANSSRKGTLGVWGQWHREDRTDNDNGVGHQGWWEQIRYVGEKLRCARWKTCTNSTRRSARLRCETKDHEQVPEDQKLWTISIGGELRVLPSLQVPRLDERALPMRHSSLSLQLSRA